MQKPPRAPDTPLLSGRDILYSLLQGGAVLAIVLLVFGVALYRGQSADDARALTFSTLVLGMLGLISANRSWSRQLLLPWRSANPAFWWVISGALGFLAAVLYIPSLSKLFRFTVLHPDDLAVCFTAGAISFFLVEAIKRRGRNNLRRR